MDNYQLVLKTVVSHFDQNYQVPDNQVSQSQLLHYEYISGKVRRYRTTDVDVSAEHILCNIITHHVSPK